MTLRNWSTISKFWTFIDSDSIRLIIVIPGSSLASKPFGEIETLICNIANDSISVSFKCLL